MAETTDGPTVPRKAKDYISQTPGSSLCSAEQKSSRGSWRREYHGLKPGGQSFQ